ncbi:MAG: DNA-processing protein DprA [candidate division Zixibacteria bacterium]|nr:DNA-processing protein DprA [candidate division Zixibacteria bacterium]
MADSSNYNPAIIFLALNRFSGLVPRQIEALLHHFSTLERIIKADSGSLMTIEGMTEEIANKVSGASKFLSEAADYYSDLSNRDILVRTRFDTDYPQLFFELNDPPALLYVRGKMPDRTMKTLTVVGTTEATNEGIELTVKLADTCTRAGIQIVSSLNKGIDAAAHLGAKKTNGTSFAIFESGFDYIDPSEEIPLAIDIARTGGVLSEYPPDQAGNSDSRELTNRLLVGISQAVVVTEVYSNSTRTLDLLSFCNQIGKLSFVLIDPIYGVKADEDSLGKAISCGAIPMVGLDKIDDIIKSLV